MRLHVSQIDRIVFNENNDIMVECIGLPWSDLEDLGQVLGLAHQRLVWTAYPIDVIAKPIGLRPIVFPDTPRGSMSAFSPVGVGPMTSASTPQSFGLALILKVPASLFHHEARL